MDIARMLLEAGAFSNDLPTVRNTMIELIIDHFISSILFYSILFFVVCHQGHRILERECYRNKLESVKLLLEFGGKFYLKNNTGNLRVYIYMSLE